MPKYVITIDDQSDWDLRFLAWEKGVSVMEVLRRAVGSMISLFQELEKKPGTKLSITNMQDEVIMDVELPS